MYVLIVVVPSLLFAFKSDLLVAAATLTAAAAFAPLRRRVQALVDRRFNRARYDASQIVGEFAVRLRENLDLDRLTMDICTVAYTTLQPTRVSVWTLERPISRSPTTKAISVRVHAE